VSGFDEVIDTRRVFNPGDVICTQHQVHQAKIHAKEKFPGARVEAVINTHCGIEPPRAEFVANFLRDATVVEPVEASLANAKKGVKYRLVAGYFSIALPGRWQTKS
jgi:hypothetical protein